MYNLEDTIEKGDVLCPGYNILRLEEKDFSVFPGHRRRRLCSAGRFNVVDLVPGYLYSGEIRILTEPCPL